MSTRLLLLALACTVICGCRRKAPPTEAAAPPAPVAMPRNEPGATVSLEQLNQALKVHYEVSPVVSDDLTVLVRAKIIPSVPPPPPGKRYFVDKQKVEVRLVNQ
ncbi:MAG: hypothetical protein ABMA26_23940 [Limisphaerales bacterium]